MPMLRCAFWLAIVYASILLHPRASTSGEGAGEAVAAKVAGMAALCGRRAGACGDAARDAAGLAELFAASVADPARPLTDWAAAELASGNGPARVAAGDRPGIPSPVPDPRRRARGRVLTGPP